MRAVGIAVGLAVIWVLLWGSASPANVLGGLAIGARPRRCSCPGCAGATAGSSSCSAASPSPASSATCWRPR